MAHQLNDIIKIENQYQIVTEVNLLSGESKSMPLGTWLVNHYYAIGTPLITIGDLLLLEGWTPPESGRG